MALRKIGRYYYAYFRDENGKLHTFATGQTVEAEAEKRAVKLLIWNRSNEKRQSEKIRAAVF